MHRSLKAHHAVLRNSIAGFSSSRVLVIGDVMLDRYILGEVQRVSPEAPVPIVDMTSVTAQLGGAANVAANIASLGGSARIVGLIGADSTGSDLQATLSTMGIPCDGLVTDSTRPTTTKTRIVAGHQQICRIDQETREPVGLSGEEALMKEIDKHIESVDVCVVSDYNKGCLTDRVTRHLIQAAGELDKPVVVDPKVRDFRKYDGCTVITPNLKEAETASGDTISGRRDLLRVASFLSSTVNCSALLITQGAQGMSLFQLGCDPLHMPAQAHRVFDVTGAGDTVVSVIALALAVGLSLERSALLANTAAGLVVQKPGTAHISAQELLSTLSPERRRRASGVHHNNDIHLGSTAASPS